jgi:hypothetical protein
MTLGPRLTASARGAEDARPVCTARVHRCAWTGKSAGRGGHAGQRGPGHGAAHRRPLGADESVDARPSGRTGALRAEGVMRTALLRKYALGTTAGYRSLAPPRLFL